MSRISEVLIGSVTPFELMMGKLIGSVAVSLLLAAIYMVGRHCSWRSHYGYGDAIHAGRPRLVAALPGPRRLHLRLDVHRHRRGVQRPQGRAGHDDARDAPADAAVR